MEELRGRQSRRRHLLPIRSHSRVDGSGLAAGGGATISCWYCDFKISSLNQPLFRFGRKYATVLRRWFSVRIGFSLAALIGVTSVCSHLLCYGSLFHLRHQTDNKFLLLQALIWLLFHGPGDSFSALLFGFSPSVSVSSAFFG